MNLYFYVYEIFQQCDRSAKLFTPIRLMAKYICNKYIWNIFCSNVSLKH